nr:hypothetical protein [Nocardioides convexus]
MVALVGSSGAGKSTLAQPGLPALRRGLRRGAAGRGRRTGPDGALDPGRGGHGDPGRPPVPRHHPRQPAAGTARGRRGRVCGTR